MSFSKAAILRFKLRADNCTKFIFKSKHNILFQLFEKVKNASIKLALLICKILKACKYIDIHDFQNDSISKLILVSFYPKAWKHSF